MHPYLFVHSMHKLFVSAHQEYMINCLKLQSAVLKEALDDLEWPGSSIQIRMQPDPPTVVFKGEGHGDLQVCYKLVCIIQFASNFLITQCHFRHLAGRIPLLCKHRPSNCVPM